MTLSTTFTKSSRPTAQKSREKARSRADKAREPPDARFQLRALISASTAADRGREWALSTIAPGYLTWRGNGSPGPVWPTRRRTRSTPPRMRRDTCRTEPVAVARSSIRCAFLWCLNADRFGGKASMQPSARSLRLIDQLIVTATCSRKPAIALRLLVRLNCRHCVHLTKSRGSGFTGRNVQG
jgi:hypothetical protein